MSVYVFSLLVGYEMSGIDIAQGRRSKYLRKLNIPVKYVFTELPDQYYIDRYTKCGIRPEEMMGVHMRLSNVENYAGNYSVEQKVAELNETMKIDDIVSREQSIILYKNGYRIAELVLKEDVRFLSSVLFFEREKLVAKEFYTDRLLYVNHYITAGQNGTICAKLKRTSFVDEKGRIICECLYEDNGEIYVFPNGESFTKYELVEKFIIEMNLTPEDIVIVDRPSYMNFVQPLFQHRNKARIMVFLHSGHYYKRGESPQGLFMNYEYYGWFKYSKYIDVMIVSTEEQKMDLEEKYRMYECHIPRIEVIPASGLEEIKYTQEERIPYSLITVSRIEPRKNIKWIIESVIKAKEMIPNIFLDIYGSGEGGYLNSLKNIVSENDAESYIRFKGSADVSELYKKYEAYISASLWETLGLTCMEAAGSGNAMIGLDVRYGNRLFIKNNINGKLIDFNMDDINNENIESDSIQKMSEAIVEVFQDKEFLKNCQNNSYKIAQNFMSGHIEEKWLDLLNEFMIKK